MLNGIYNSSCITRKYNVSETRSRSEARANNIMNSDVEKEKLSAETSKSNQTGVILSLSQRDGYVVKKAGGAQASVKAAANFRVLKIGMSGTDVYELQCNLTKLGFDTKGTDGKFGPATRDAVMRYQKARGLNPVDGIAGRDTQNKIKEDIEKLNQKPIYEVLKKGDRGSKVTSLQQKLTNAGYTTNGIDGDYGNNTLNAVKAFQRTHGLTADGVAGETTQKELDRVIRAKGNVSNVGTKRDVAITFSNVRGDYENGKKIWDALINAGFSKEAAAGVLGNLDVESGFSTAWSGDQGSVGLAQWRLGRKDALSKYASDRGVSATDLNLQIEFLINKDLKDQLTASEIKRLKESSDFVDAADLFCSRFERPAAFASKTDWQNSRYGEGKPNYISWDRFEWSEATQTYVVDLKARRSAARAWYHAFA